MFDPLSIVGMNFRLPGANSDDELWALLKDRRSAISSIPKDRWQTDLHYSPHAQDLNKTVMQRGGFLDRIDGFDAAFFDLSAREARAMDPQQRLLLECTWHCLENAGLNPQDLKGRSVGVFTGLMATDYQQNATAPGQKVDGYACLGTYGALLANRISHIYEWTGPSYTIDAACASSLVALDSARHALQTGQIEFALVAAANALINPWRSISFSQARMLGVSGACHSFSAAADGYVQGEGCVAIMMCSRETAAKYGLTERALVLGSAVNHVGPSRSQTAPSVASQRAVITAALENAGVKPDQLGYIEAHGTGTPLGDPIEIGALGHVLGTKLDTPCAIGSIKSNIGHLEAAAGLAGLAKLVLMLEHQKLAPGRGPDEVNPLIDFEAGPLRPVSEVSAWLEDRQFAGISCFGFGGANSHAVIASPAALKAPVPKFRRQVARRDFPMILSAKNDVALKEIAKHLITLAKEGNADLSDVCQTLMQRRASLPARAAAVVGTWTEAIKFLEYVAEEGSASAAPAKMLLHIEAGASLTGTAWAKLTGCQPELAGMVDEAVEQAKEDGARAGKRLTQLSRLDAVLRLVLQTGLAPDVILGDGLGRWASLSATGVLKLSDAVLSTSTTDHDVANLYRPSLPVWDAINETMLVPRRIDPNYLADLGQGLEVDLKSLSNLALQAQALIASNRTYAGYLTRIGTELALLGHTDWRDWDSIPPQDVCKARLALLTFAIARRQTCARWNIPEVGVDLEGSASEIAELVCLQALTISDALSLAGEMTDFSGLAGRVNTIKLADAEQNPALPRLSETWHSLDEIEYTELKASGRRARSLKAGQFDTMISVDIGEPTHEGIGETTQLPLDETFARALLCLMAARWAEGYDIDWSICAAPHNVATLPSYPFQHKRYWLEKPSLPTEPTREDLVDPAPIYDITWKSILAANEVHDDISRVGQVFLLSDGDGISQTAFTRISKWLPSTQNLTGALDETMVQKIAEATGDDDTATLIIRIPFSWGNEGPEVSKPIDVVSEEFLVPLVRFVQDLSCTQKKFNLVLLGRDHSDNSLKPLPDPILAAATAAAISVAGEHSNRLSVLGVAIPSAPQDWPDMPAMFQQCLGITAPLGLLSLSNDGLRVKCLSNDAVPAYDGAPVVSGTWLVIGGLGGIGKSLLKHLHKRGQPLAVIGRRSIDEVRDAIAEFSDQGIEIAYYCADATDPITIATAISAIETDLGPIATFIHCEMVLADAAAANMDSATFTRAFQPKASAILTMRQVFEGLRADAPLPKQVIFSSILGLIGNPGQANYTAGSAFQTALCDLLAFNGADILAIAWGYWGEDGRVANAIHKRRVAQIGLQPMSSAAGFAAFDALLSYGSSSVVAGEFEPARLTRLFQVDVPPISNTEISTPSNVNQATRGLDLLDAYAIARMRAALDTAGWTTGDPGLVAADQIRLFEAISFFLQTPPDESAEELYSIITDQHPQLSGSLDVVKAATENLVEVLSGAVSGTSVLFGGANTELLDRFYAGNPLADAANDAIAKAVANDVATRIKLGGADSKPLRILEIGAGTGGTTRSVLSELQPYSDHISFVFSDISVAFLKRANETLGQDRPWFSTARFDFDSSPDKFAQLGQFDIIFAANAVHVTQHIAPMLKRVAARLAPGGSLILNELMRPMPHLTSIFGLLPGWWVAQDNRAGIGPLLSETQWCHALAEDFEVDMIDGPRDSTGIIQGIAVAKLQATAQRWTGSEVSQPMPKLIADKVIADADSMGILAMLANVLGIEVDLLDPQARFDELGLDSILSLEFSDRLAADFNLKLDPATIADLATPSQLIGMATQSTLPDKPIETTEVNSMLDDPDIKTKPPQPDLKNVDGIAIVGMAGRFAGAESLSALARLIDGKNTKFAPVQAGRWSASERAVAPDVADMYGSFLSDAEEFDAARFGISAREAILIPPEHRAVLEQALAALSDGARPDLRMEPDTQVGVFVGGSSGDYTQKLAIGGHPIEPQSLAAQLGSGAAARVARAFGFSGPAFTVDLACASGLGALHLATRALENKECELAVVVAASIQSTPGFAAQVHRAGLLSTTQFPRPFDTNPVGIMLGEGVVALVLKPLSNAVADGDRIDATIVGTSVRQSIGQDGMTAPSSDTQHQAMSSALKAARMDATEIGAIEAHGVGTAAGDQAELEALTQLFQKTRRPVELDTVKPVLGHGLAVSGLTSVVLTALAWRLNTRLSRLAAEEGRDSLAEGRLVPAQTQQQANALQTPTSLPVLVNVFSLNGAASAAVLIPPTCAATASDDENISGRNIRLSAALPSDLHEKLKALSDWLCAENITAAEAATILANEGGRRCAVVLSALNTQTLKIAVADAVSNPGQAGQFHHFETGSEIKKTITAPLTPVRRPVGYPFARKRFWPVETLTRSDPATSDMPTPIASFAETEDKGSGIAIVADALRIAPNLIDDRAVLLDLGLDSILAIELRGRLINEGGLAVSLSDLMSRRPIAGILASALPAAAVPALVPDRQPRFDPFALTELQLAYLVGRSPAVPLGGNGCHVYWELHADNPFDIPRLSDAWARLVETHGMLRAVFTEDGQQNVQPTVVVPDIPLHDWSHLDDDRASAALEALRERMSHEVFEPTSWPLFRIETSQRHKTTRLHLSIDLLIIDVLSLFRLLQQWAQLYHQPDTVLNAPGIEFRDYVNYLSGPALTAERDLALAYWQDEMTRMPAGPQLPRARSDQDLTGATFVRRRLTLAPENWAHWQACAREVGATPVAALCSALGATFAYWSVDPKLALNLTIYNRRPVHPELDQVIGDFTSTVLMSSGRDEHGFGNAASDFAQLLAKNLEQTAVSSAEAVRRFAPPPADGVSPATALPYVFTSMIGYNSVIGQTDVPSLGRLMDGVTQTPQVLIDVQAIEDEGSLVVTWDCVDAAYPNGLLDSAFGGFSDMIHRFAEPDADWSKSMFDALGLQDQQRREKINTTHGAISDDLLHEPILRQALLTPDRVALITPQGDWSYRELIGRALAIAEICEASSSELIGVALPRGAWQIAATLGVLISGSAYLPLEPTLPPDRFAALVMRGEADLILTDSVTAPTLSVPEGSNLALVDAIVPMRLPSDLPERRSTADDLAYVLFTSGSTGKPKGVMLEHRAVLNTVLDVNDRFSVGQSDRVLGLASLGFDLSVYDIFGPLAVGGALVLPETGAERDPERLAELISQHRVTLWNSVPMIMEMLAASEPEPASLSSLRLILLSGDWIPTSLPNNLERIIPQARLVSLGGATEAAIWSICHDVTEVHEGWSSIPYGRPMRNQQFHILDTAHSAVPDGIEGDLYISGAGLARGYWRDRDRTDAAFFAHPKTGERLYRTGDRGRWRDGQLIEFLGRKDGQVKIGGFRIELGEVEACACLLNGVHRAVVITDDAPGGQKQLRLWAMLELDSPVTAMTLREHLANSLPKYMIPSQIEIIANLPLTANGKVDRKALLGDPVPQPQEVSRSAESNRPADQYLSTDLPASIASIVAQEIGITDPDPEKTFFELGANSLNAVTINRRLRAELGLATRVTDLFEHPSIRLLIDYLAPGIDLVKASPQSEKSDTLNAGATALQRTAQRRRSFRKSILADVSS